MTASVAGVSINAPPVLADDLFAVALASAVFVFETVAGASAGVSTVLLCNTDTFPLSAGVEISKADSINTVAAPIVIRDRTEAVPRGEKAELDTLLVNNAPASVLPGCSSTDPINAIQAVKNNTYKM